MSVIVSYAKLRAGLAGGHEECRKREVDNEARVLGGIPLRLRESTRARISLGLRRWEFCRIISGVF